MFLFGACFLFSDSKIITLQSVLNPHFTEHPFNVFSFPFMFSLLLFIIIIFSFSFGHFYLPQRNFFLSLSLKSLFHPDFPQIAEDDEGWGEAIMGCSGRGEVTVSRLGCGLKATVGFN